MESVHKSNKNNWGLTVGSGLLYFTTATTILALVHKALPSQVRNNLPTDLLKSPSLANRVLKVSTPTFAATAVFTYYQSRAAAFNSPNPLQPDDSRKEQEKNSTTRGKKDSGDSSNTDTTTTGSSGGSKGTGGQGTTQAAPSTPEQKETNNPEYTTQTEPDAKKHSGSGSASSDTETGDAANQQQQNRALKETQEGNLADTVSQTTEDSSLPKVKNDAWELNIPNKSPQANTPPSTTTTSTPSTTAQTTQGSTHNGEEEEEEEGGVPTVVNTHTSNATNTGVSTSSKNATPASFPKAAKKKRRSPSPMDVIVQGRRKTLQNLQDLPAPTFAQEAAPGTWTAICRPLLKMPEWKQNHCLLALSLYRKELFQNIAHWKLSQEDIKKYTLKGDAITKNICNEQAGLQELDAYQGWLEQEYERLVHELFCLPFTPKQDIANQKTPSKELAEQIQPALKNLFEQKTGTWVLLELYEQFDLMPTAKKQAAKQEPTNYSAPLRDALRFLLGVRLHEAERALGAKVVDTSRHRIFKEMLDKVGEHKQYHTHANACGKWLREGNSKTDPKGIPNARQNALHLHLAMQLAKAYFAKTCFLDFSEKNLNDLVPTKSGALLIQDEQQEKEGHPIGLGATIRRQARAIEARLNQNTSQADTAMSSIAVNARKGGAKGKYFGFNPTSQGNIPSVMFHAKYETKTSDIITMFKGETENLPQTTEKHTTVTLACPVPTRDPNCGVTGLAVQALFDNTIGWALGSKAEEKKPDVVGSFKLFIDAIYVAKEQLLNICLLNDQSHDEKPRIDAFLTQIMKIPRYRKTVMYVRLPMDGDYYNADGKLFEEGPFPIERVKNITKMVMGYYAINKPVNERYGFYIDWGQMKEWYDERYGEGEFSRQAVIDEALKRTCDEYFKKEHVKNINNLTPKEIEAFKLLFQAKFDKLLVAIFKHGWRIKRCKDCQDRASTAQVVHGYDNLRETGQHKYVDDEGQPIQNRQLKQMQVAFHSRALENKDQGVLGTDLKKGKKRHGGRLEYAIHTIKHMEHVDSILEKQKEKIEPNTPIYRITKMRYGAPKNHSIQI